LNEAKKKSAAGSSDEAWSHLTKAAWEIGYIQGEQEAIFENSTDEAVRNQLRTNAKKGGKSKGANSEAIRNNVARKLIDLAPNGKWPDRAHFDRSYHKVSKDTPGFSGSEYHRRQLLKRADIQATLPQGKKRSR